MLKLALKNEVDYMTNVGKTTYLINIKLFTYLLLLPLIRGRVAGAADPANGSKLSFPGPH